MTGHNAVTMVVLGLYMLLPWDVFAADVLTVAGIGVKGYSGDGGTGSNAQVGEPYGISKGPDGALYICEIASHVIRRLDSGTGRITTVAGSGKPGYAGDGGPATRALLNEPYEVRFDGQGNMYFVEMRNNIVRRVEAGTKIISTVAGNSKTGFSGDDGPAIKAQLSRPHSITLDNNGNLYICDIGNHRIRRVDLRTGIISTFAGTGQRKPTPDGAPLAGTPLNSPRALDFDGNHSLFLALRQGNAVYRIDLRSKTLHHLAGTGEQGYSGDGKNARNARLSGPKGIAIGPGGDIYLADTESHTIRVIHSKSGIIKTLIGDGQRGDGPDGDPHGCRLARPHGVFVDTRGDVYVGDSENYRVRKFSLQTKPVGVTDKGWTRIKLDDAFRSEGVTVTDVNQDGRNDVIAGDLWYESPKASDLNYSKGDWKRHWIRPKKEFVAGVGYSDSFCNFAYDVNRDGWTDLIYISFPGKEFYWYENPKNTAGLWKEHLVWHSICNESPDFVDITGDGIPEVVFGSQPESQLGYASIPSPAAASKKWTFNSVSRVGDPRKNGTFKYYHGLGNGDLNNDGRTDLLIMHGWWEAPSETTNSPWQFHAYNLSKTGSDDALHGCDIHVYDLDLDGDNDIITSSAHDYGIWWFENVGGNDSPRFEYRLIDDSYSQTHAMELVDINGDGTRDIVTGKRFYAHNSRDPGGKEPVVMHWYEIHRRRGVSPDFIRHEIEAGRETGVGTQFLAVDFDIDGRLDIALSNKKGVNILLQNR